MSSSQLNLAVLAKQVIHRARPHLLPAVVEGRALAGRVGTEDVGPGQPVHEKQLAMRAAGSSSTRPVDLPALSAASFAQVDR